MASNDAIAFEESGVGKVSPEARSAIKQGVMGPSMAKLSLERQSARMDLENSGRLKPSTIINFNPVSLKVQDMNAPWRIPAATDAAKKGIELNHGGRRYKGAQFTVREPAFNAWIKDVVKPADEGENPDGKYDPYFILPIELTDQFRIEYTTPSKIPMGGVLVIEGDIHSLIHKGNLVPQILVPRSKRLPNGRRSYYSEVADTQKELAATFSMQKDYCNFMVQQGDEYNQDDANRKNITPVHRLWLTFAIDMGWKQTVPDWMNSKFESEEACKGCGKGRTRADAWFCICGRPYNPYAAFMAGENVAESYLYSLKGKELDDVMKELSRREKLRAAIRGEAPSKG